MAVLVGHVGQSLHLEAVPQAGLAQQVDVAAALVAEAEVLAHQQPARLQALDQQVLDEGVGRHFGQPGIEAPHHHLGNAIAGQRGQLVAQAGDAGGRQFRPAVQGGKVLPRMRFEGHHGGRQAAFARDLADAREHGLVSAMDAVEIADGQGAGRALSGRGQGSVDAQRRFHGREFTILDSGSVRTPRILAPEGGGPVPNPPPLLGKMARRAGMRARRRAGFFSEIAILPDSSLIKRRLVILISGRGSNMQALVQACRDQGWPAEVVAVIASRPDAAGLDWARAQGIAASALHHKEYASREAFDAALAEEIDRHAPDYVILAGFMRVLTPGFVNHFAGRLVNIHPSLLPAFPGLHTHAQALATGVRVHGCTVHFVTPVLDHGPIIAQGCVPVLAGDTPDSLANRVLEVEHRAFPAAVRWLAEGRVTLTPDHRVDVQGDPERLFTWSPAA